MSTQESYDEKKLEQAPDDGKGIDWIQLAREAVLSKGQSKRIWNELYKVQKQPLKIPDYRSLTRLMWS